MRAEDLVALAAPHAVDLLQAARQGVPRAQRDVVLQRFQSGRRAPVLVEPSTNRARGAQAHTASRPEWSLAEIGQAAAGVPEIPFMAACFAFAGERSNFWKLQAALFREALVLQRQHQWPPEIVDIFGISAPYLKHVAKLVLDEDATPQPFRSTPELYSIYLRISNEVWEKTIADRFTELKLVWLDWLNTAARIMQPRLTEDNL